MVKEAGVAIIGQTGDLAPADKRIYAVRDITATVESIAMITGSILSKKLASGLEALVMDVKVGSGAFMPTFEARRAGQEHSRGGQRCWLPYFGALDRHEPGAGLQRRQRGGSA